MSTNNVTNESVKPTDINAFFDEDTNSGFKFKDMVYLVLRNLHWFLIFAVVGGIIAYYMVRKQERIYASSASIMIKTAASGGSESFRGSSTLNAISGPGLFISTVSNEIMVMKSQSNMENMVRELNLNVVYSYKTRVSRRNKDLYKEAPVEVVFPGMDEQAKATFSLKPIDAEHVLLSDFGGDIPDMNVKLNDTVISPFGRMVVKPTWRYADFMNTTITVTHYSVSYIASVYRSRITIKRDNEKNSILNLSVTDTSPLRAADVLNALMDVYNRESIADQQRVLDYTEQFINERIDFLMSDIQEYEEASVGFNINIFYYFKFI